MRAMVWGGTGGLGSVREAELPDPRPGTGAVLVEVRAAALNAVDAAVAGASGAAGAAFGLAARAMGLAGSPIGSEAAGVVAEVGPGVSGVSVGDRVFGKTGGAFPKGAVAQLAVMDAGRFAEVPGCWSFEQASCVSVSFETALNAVRRAGVGPGDEVMVYGSSGGVGLFAVQLARARGARVTGVCSTRNLSLARESGCEEVIDYRREDFTGVGRRFDAIIGVNGRNPMRAYEGLLKEDGVFVGVGDVRQAAAALARSMTSRRFRAVVGLAEPQPGYLELASELAASGLLRPHIDGVYGAAQAREALRHMVEDHAQGKVVIRADFS